MSKFELVKSASEEENNGTEESETSDDEYLSDFTKLKLYMYEPCVSKEFVKENCPGKESSKSEDIVGLDILSGLLVVNKYKPMATYAESIYCLDKYEIGESYFKGILSFAFEIFYPVIY